VSGISSTTGKNAVAAGPENHNILPGDSILHDPVTKFNWGIGASYIINFGGVQSGIAPLFVYRERKTSIVEKIQIIREGIKVSGCSSFNAPHLTVSDGISSRRCSHNDPTIASPPT
jgi:hypothetical protein